VGKSTETPKPVVLEKEWIIMNNKILLFFEDRKTAIARCHGLILSPYITLHFSLLVPKLNAKFNGGSSK
jgi:hypothetical protein